MIRWQVRFEYPHKTTRRITYGVRHVLARDKDEAKAKIRAAVPGSYGHYVISGSLG